MTSPPSFALLIGAMKAGTTSLFSWLEPHPQVATPRTKEPFLFAREPPPTSLEAYASNFAWKPQHRVGLEASTDYAKYPAVPDVPERVASLGVAHFRILYLVRHPARRIESQVRHGLSTRQVILGRAEPPRDFSLAAGLSREQLDFSRYAMQLQRWSAQFPRDRILVLVLEELKASPRAVLTRVAEFLDIDADWPFPTAGEVMARSPHEFPGLHPAWRWLRDDTPAGPWVRRLVPSRVRRRLRRTLNHGGTRHKLSAQEEAEVLQALRPDLARLRDHWGVDTRRWWGL